jgi:thiol:disulfide interchange protein DsbD
LQGTRMKGVIHFRPLFRLQAYTAKAFLTVFLTVFTLCFVTLPALASVAQVEVIQSQDRYQVGRHYPLLFRIKISKGWYLHGTGEAEQGLVPTRLSFSQTPGVQIDHIVLPLPEFTKFDYTSQPIPTFSGQILVDGTLRISGDASLGEQTIRGNLSYQACSASTCFPPQTVSVTVPVEVVPTGTTVHSLNQNLFLREEERGGPSSASLWLSLIFFFLGGLALNLTPCIYPLIPITVSYFGGRSAGITGNTYVHSGLYMLGLAVTNSLLGLWAVLSGQMLGSILQKPLVIILIACLFLLLGLSFFGLWEFRLPGWLTRKASKNHGGYFGSLFMGLTLGIVAAPCLGPFILGLLTYVAQLGNPFTGFLCFFVLSLGLGLPLAVLAFFAGAVDRLPLSGDWMVWIRKLMGWVLVAMAFYMIRPLIPFHWGKPALMALVLFAASLHLCWLDRSGEGFRRFVFFKRAMGLFLFVGALAYLGIGTYSGQGVAWVPYRESRMESAFQQKKPVILDFYAEWCVPCRIMDSKVFTAPEVVQLSRQVVMMRVDLTKRRTDQEAVLKRWGVRGVPTVLFFNRNGTEMRNLSMESYVDKEAFLRRLEELVEEKGSYGSQ